jgi:hypothetical protein
MRRNLLAYLSELAGTALMLFIGHVLAEDKDRAEELLRQLARRVKATNERAMGRV